MSKVSIIIPCFKQAHFLAQAVDSALAQTHADLEVLVIDDGSPDDTAAVAARYAGDARFKYVRQENTGLPGARNRGIGESSGEYLCFLDSDDTYAPSKVARQVALLDADPALGWVYCDIVTVDEQGVAVPDQFSIAATKRDLSGDLFSSLMLGGYFPPHTVMIRRAVLDEVGGFDPALGGHADYELWLRVAGAGHRAAFVPEALANYRVHASSMSKDGEHMHTSRVATLVKIARLHPDKVAAGADRLQQSIADLFAANQWMRRRQEEAPAGGGGFDGGGDQEESGSETYPLLRHFGKARRGKGKENQAAIWDVTLDGRQDRGIFLQPPADLTFRIPTGEHGRFQSAVCVHPLAWDKPGAGGCEFHLRIDGRVVHVVALDPIHLPADRHWHELNVAVPERADGFHEISLEVCPIGGSAAYRWGIWRAPKFSYTAPVAAPVNPSIAFQ